jgi:hypothetical protein
MHTHTKILSGTLRNKFEEHDIERNGGKSNTNMHAGMHMYWQNKYAGMLSFLLKKSFWPFTSNSLRN